MGASRARIDDDGCLTMTLRFGGGQHHDLVLEVSDRPIDGQLARPDEMWQATEEGWSTVVPPCDRLIAVRRLGDGGTGGAGGRAGKAINPIRNIAK